MCRPAAGQWGLLGFQLQQWFCTGMTVSLSGGTGRALQRTDCAPLVEQQLGASFTLTEMQWGVTRGCDSYWRWTALVQVPERLQIYPQVMQEHGLSV